MKNKFLFSFIIPTHNSQQTIIRLLNSINVTVSKKIHDFEAIIVDDYSKDQTVDNVKNVSKNVKFLTKIIPVKRHIGPAKARNIGAKYAQGKYLVFLDGDVELKKNTLKNIDNLLSKEKIKAFTGIWDYHQKTQAFFPQFKALRDWTYWFIEREKGCRYYLFSTRIAGIEKNLFKKLYGFNETYPEPTVEDIEFTYRIERQSPIKFASNIIVGHEFEGFWPIAVKYFKRSRDWIKLFTVRRQFDPVATSKREALKPISLAMFLSCLFIFILFKIKIILLTGLFFFLIFILAEAKFMIFLYQKKGLAFMVRGFLTAIILYLVIGLGTATGLLSKRGR